jgi:hypothetical protein
MDFTLKRYETLIHCFIRQGYLCSPVLEFAKQVSFDGKILVLRHDVDKKPSLALQMAQLEHRLRVHSTFYFTYTEQKSDLAIIKEINKLGHEIGYHYNELSVCRGDTEKAYELFSKHLARMRNYSDIQSLCMDGTPWSVYDNRHLWNHYDYKSMGLQVEPYLDLDFSEMLYLTDTGRSWDNSKFNVRDKVVSKVKVECKTSRDLMDLLEKGKLPARIMINAHPERWTNHPTTWLLEWGLQPIKNVFKQFLILRRKRRKTDAG